MEKTNGHIRKNGKLHDDPIENLPVKHKEALVKILSRFIR